MERRQVDLNSEVELARMFCFEKFGNASIKSQNHLVVLAMAKACCVKDSIDGVFKFVENYRKKFVVHSRK